MDWDKMESSQMDDSGSAPNPLSKIISTVMTYAQIAISQLNGSVKNLFQFLNKNYTWVVRIALLVYGAFAIYYTFFMNPNNPFAQSPAGLEELKSMFYGFSKIGVLLLGVYAEVSKSQFAFRLFICFVCIDGVVGLVTILISNPSGFVLLEENQRVTDMWQSQAVYNWTPYQKQDDSSDTTDQVKPDQKLTLAWDRVQAEGCCGVDSYKDWDRLRPDILPADGYPRSCCNTPNKTVDGYPFVFLCDETTVFMMGCRKKLNIIEASKDQLAFWLSVMEIGLAVLYYYHQLKGNLDEPTREQLLNHFNLLSLSGPANQPIITALGAKKIAGLAGLSPPKYGATIKDGDETLWVDN